MSCAASARGIATQERKREFSSPGEGSVVRLDPLAPILEADGGRC